MKLSCRSCARPVSGQQVRLAFACMIELGVPVAEARSRSPCCFACARKQVSAERTGERNSAHSVAGGSTG